MRLDDTCAAALADELARAAIARLDPVTATELAARARDLLPLVLGLLRGLYGERAEQLVGDIVSDLVELAAGRPADLRELDRRRSADPLWFQDPARTGYVCYVDRFAETLPGMHQHLDHLERLGVCYLHLMPLLAPRPGESDGGYAVADYDAVDPRLGTIADLTELARELHGRNIALCVDLVLNHTAREHTWARAAMAGDAVYRKFYFVFGDRTEPDEYERTAPDIFPQLAPGSFTYVPELDGWVWTTFREFQWDLDYRNPAVFRAMVATMITLANRGPDVLRLDAVPFLWKQMGTDCMNRPEAHVLLQAFRAVLSIVAPGVLLKAEAMVAPEILTGYLGAHPDGERAECNLAYDNQLMVMLWSMLATGTSELARHALSRRPPAPASTSWVTYLRCHDDIGWAVSDADAAAVGLDGVEQRRLLSTTYASGASGWRSLGVAFQADASGAAPTSGMTAALTGLQAARVIGDPAMIDVAVARIEALYSIVFSFGGIPLIYSGDEVGLGNDEAWADDPAHAGDNRWLHRPPMDWAALARGAADTTSVEARLVRRFGELARARAALAPLRAGIPARILDLADDGVFGYLRGPLDGRRVLAVIDVGGSGSTVQLPESAGLDPALAHTGSGGAHLADTRLTLPPYGFAWLTG
ncbi:MAG: alpha-amylase family glycosyl hydrolase [Actinomycetota bacterium]|nr:alpha-amylase family glycosyl hydrolase [Actinomycetota bacterium]